MFIERQWQKNGLKLRLISLGWAESIKRSSDSTKVYRGFSHSPTANSKLVKKKPTLRPSLFWDVTKKSKDLPYPAADPRNNSKFQAALDASNSKPEIFMSNFHPKRSRHYVDTKPPPSSTRDLTPPLPSVHNHSMCTSSRFTFIISKCFVSKKIFTKGTGSLWLAIFRVENSARAPSHYTPYSCPV